MTVSQFVTPELEHLFTQHQLDSFTALWELDLPWFETPNKRRNGWSGVCKLNLDGEVFFLKRQQNHNARTVQHPITGVPTFKREFDNIARFQRLNVPALAAAYYGERCCGENREAILITRSLEGFVAMDQWYHSMGSSQPLTATATGKAVFDQVAKLMATLHNAGLAHWGTYPHHIFVRPDGTEARFIDLERARWQPPYRRRRKDLDVFYRHAGYMHKHDLDYLLAQYFVCSGKVWQAAKLRREINERITRVSGQ